MRRQQAARLASLGARAALPRPTVRLRLTALYGALFLASGAGLLAITNILARSWTWPPGAKIPVSASRHAIDTALMHQVAAQEAHERAAALTHLLVVSAIALGVMAVAAAGLGWLVAGRVLRPLRDMTTATQRISADNLGERLAVTGPGDELKDLGDTIDGLLQRLETAFGAQRLFAANASHELRTPLAMMRTSLDVATAKPGPVPPEVTVLAGKLREGLDQADRLVENLLLLARAQHGAKDDQETVSLGRMVASAIEAGGDRIARMGLQVRQANADAWVAGNPTLLARMTGNLIDNAIRHNQPDGWIRAQVTATGPTARLVVENGGSGLDPDKISELAQPFRRLGADRTDPAGGTGLGLSIVTAIASAHDGKLRLQARPEGGLRAVVELPRAITVMPAMPPAKSARAGSAW
jgi:signal transduction histidine kinase